MEPGSSGSALINNQKRVIGQLYGPYNGQRCPPHTCNYPSGQRVAYGKFSISWNGDGASQDGRKLEPWLDPYGTGDITLDGLDECGYLTITAEKYSSYVGNDELGMCQSGYYSLAVSNQSFFSGITIEWEVSGNLKTIATSGYNIGVKPLGHGTAWIMATFEKNGCRIKLPKYYINILPTTTNFFNNKTIVRDTTWYYTPYNPDSQGDFYLELSGDINIQNNAKLTIVNIDVKCTPNAKFNVKQGSKLIINGARLTSLCTDEHWQGIQVWGNRNAHQFPDANGNYLQGYLELNNATIENAICAADLWKPNDWYSTGGVLKATNSTFRNNSRSIHALLYRNYVPTNPNIEREYNCVVENCIFEITDDYITTIPYFKHVDMHEVNGIKFSGCDFSLSPRAEGVEDWNIAIGAYSASFVVNGICNSNLYPCPNMDNSTFTGFRTAIYADNASNKTIKSYISNTEFDNNTFAVWAENLTHLGVAKCDFTIGNSKYLGCPIGTSCGIYTNFCNKHDIRLNSFTKTPSATNTAGTGIYTENSRGANDIYKNSFSNLNYGNFAIWQNHTTPSSLTGLEFLCNENSNNIADFYIPKINNSPNINAVQNPQGTPFLAAGNTFSQSNNTWHFYNGGTSWLSYHCAGGSEYIPTEIYQVTVSPSSNINQCPDNPGGGDIPPIDGFVLDDDEIAEREQAYASNLYNYNQTKVLYDNLKDGGSTEQRIIDVDNAQASNMWQLRTDLLGYSPHLSDTVLKKVADKTAVFPDAVIFDIFAANPDELKKAEIIEYLENKAQPLPAYMVDVLKQMAAGETYRTSLEKTMSMYKKNMYRAAQDIIRSYTYDTVPNKYVQVRNWLDNIGGYQADMQIISTYLSENNYTDALSLANIMPGIYNLSGNDLDEHNMFLNILQLYKNVYDSGRQLPQLTEAEENIIVEIANTSNDIAGSMAKSWLRGNRNLFMELCLDCSSSGGNTKSSSVINPEVLAKIHNLTVSVSPNPTKYYTTIAYTIPETESSATLSISDMSGKVVKQNTLTAKQGQLVWNTTNVKSGIYMLILQSGNNIVKEKISVVN